jgi:hypothetical protein
MVQVALSILKPVGRVGATVQLAIAPSELLKVMFVMVEPIIAIWSTPATGQTTTATVNLAILLPDSVPATLTAVATGVPNEITLSWAGVTGATAYRGGCYCVYSRSAYLSWSATDGTSCTVNT